MTLRAAVLRVVVAVLFMVCAVAAPARAQGHGHGPPPGHGHGSSSSGGQGGGGAASAPAVDRDPGPTGTAELPLRNFGAWVDDAFVLDPGEAWAGVGLAYSRLSYANQIDVPVMDASLGLVRHVQIAATLPVSNLQYPDGFNSRYLGDAYVSAKIGLHAAGNGSIGVAVAPILEILSDGSAPDAAGQPIGRVHWGLPVDIEYDGQGWRAYGSAGYFSRGSIFGSTTIDVSAGSRAGVLGIVSFTHSTADPLVFDTGVNTGRSRTDASAGAYARIAPSLSAYGLVGKTISEQDPYSSSLSLSVGVSFRVAPARSAGGTGKPRK